MTSDGFDHEIGFINAFLRKDRRSRALAFVKNKRNREKLIRCLVDEPKESRFAERMWQNLPLNNNQDKLAVLRKLDAPEKCYLISDDIKIDKTTMRLEEALDVIEKTCLDVMLSCIAGKLVYGVMDDGDYYILSTQQ